MKRGLFLDRDGVINREKNYLYKISELEWIEGIFELTKFAAEKSLQIFIVTNQSGIARGYYTEVDFHRLTKHMTSVFEKNNIKIADIFYCPFHPDASIPKFRGDHPWRKPRPGMFFAARDLYNLDLVNSFMIGDRQSDVQAAEAAGIQNIALLGSKYRHSESSNVINVSHLSQCIGWIIEKL